MCLNGKKLRSGIPQWFAFLLVERCHCGPHYYISLLFISEDNYGYIIVDSLNKDNTQ